MTATESTSESASQPYGRWVEIEFDCLPLRSLSRVDIPVDASPVYEQFLLRVKAAIEKHGFHNTHYLYRGRCRFHLTNDPARGQLTFGFEGAVLTDDRDHNTRGLDLQIELVGETCGWLNERIVEFFVASVRQAVAVEFDRYIRAGDPDKSQCQLEELERTIEASGGFIGMHL